jgi:hypothetical protein
MSNLFKVLGWFLGAVAVGMGVVFIITGYFAITDAQEASSGTMNQIGLVVDADFREQVTERKTFGRVAIIGGALSLLFGIALLWRRKR